jgi:hypothetical protein
MKVPELQPKRTWYRRKRTWAAIALWLVIAYPLSVGPAFYGMGRGWLPIKQTSALYGPSYFAASALGYEIAWMRWTGAWYFRGIDDSRD